MVREVGGAQPCLLKAGPQTSEREEMSYCSYLNFPGQYQDKLRHYLPFKGWPFLSKPNVSHYLIITLNKGG